MNLSMLFCLATVIVVVTGAKNIAQYLKDLRALMQHIPNNGSSISAYIIPMDDNHQNEFISPRDKRISLVSRFTGSKGTAVVTQKEALLWTDGRYYQQAEEQLDGDWTIMKQGLTQTPTIESWLSMHLSAGDVVGVDGNLISLDVWSTLQWTLKKYNIQLVSIESNLIDLIWLNQPPRKFNPIIALDLNNTGKKISEAVKSIQTEMHNQNAELLVVTALDEIAWLFNLRGSDIDYNPVFYSYALITPNEVYLFVEKTQLPKEYKDHFIKNDISVKVENYNDIRDVLKKLVDKLTGKVWISSSSSYAINALVPSRKRLQESTPIGMMKSIKNAAEAQGMINSHIRDGVALCKYFAWLEDAINKGEKVDEISGAAKLKGFRENQPKYVSLSFQTISASGPNGALIHYEPQPKTNRPISRNEMYLCDSGAQYLDGTTDVTRTWHFGNPTQHEIEMFTRVLKGQISFGMAVFPNNEMSTTIDILARRPLWDVGLDYHHGTGHGIGHFLNTHESPIIIGSFYPGLQKNMFVSIEPGYYENGHFGVRHEDIVQIVPADVPYDFDKRGALAFKTITMCPIQTKLINKTLLANNEREHLNNYHATVRNTLKPILQKEGDEFTIKWLEKETQPI